MLKSKSRVLGYVRVLKSKSPRGRRVDTVSLSRWYLYLVAAVSLSRAASLFASLLVLLAPTFDYVTPSCAHESTGAQGTLTIYSEYYSEFC